MRRRKQRGAELLEMALVTIPMFAIILFMVNGCLVIFTKAVLQHAVREGVRFAVTGRTLPGQGHDLSIKSTVQQQAIGLLAGADKAAKIHVRYYVPGTLAETASNAGGNIVEVSVESLSWTWHGSLLLTAPRLTLLARASDRMEPSPGGIPPTR
jgi:Flp pilus assembly protein TadG